MTTFLIFSVKATYHTNPKIALLPFDFWFDTIEFIHMYICIFDLSGFDPILSYVHFLVLINGSEVQKKIVKGDSGEVA